jgi:hypothetical protein
VCSSDLRRFEVRELHIVLLGWLTEGWDFKVICNRRVLMLWGCFGSPEEVSSLLFLTKLALQFQPWKIDRGRPRRRWKEQGNLKWNELRGLYNVHDDDDGDYDDIMHQ